jgi:hypothetical protein
MVVIDTSSNTAGHIGTLQSNDVTAVGRYYSSKAWKRITKAEANALSAAGIKIFVVFEDFGSPNLTADQGAHDAQIALQQASGIEQPEGTAIYFAVEGLPDGYDKEDLPGIRAYFAGVNGVLAGRYKAGVYSDGVVCDDLLNKSLCQYAWLSASTAFPGSKAFYNSGRWALAQRKVDLDWSGLSVDTNEAKAEFGGFLLQAHLPSGIAAATESFALLSMGTTSGGTVPVTGWTLLVERIRTEQRSSEARARTVGNYQVYRNGQAVAGLGGMTVEREGPGDNGPVGVEDHRCIEGGTYPLHGHVTENYAIVGYETDGDHPRPCLGVGATSSRTAILVHPASGYGSTIGCINLASTLTDADSDFSLANSTRRVIAVLEDLRSFNGGTLPRASEIANAHLVVIDPPLDQIGRQPLRLGSRGPLVAQWQAFLVSQGASLGAPDGNFGAATRDATRSFQQSRGLAGDGMVGPNTLAAARQLGFGAPATRAPSEAALAAMGGHMLPEDDSPELALENAADGNAGTRAALIRRMAMTLVADVPRLLGPPEDDVAEFSFGSIGAPPDFARAMAGEQAAVALVESMFAGVETGDFDFPAFEAFVRGLGLQHFTPLEFLFLGASNQAGPCAGKNSLPPRQLWPNIANTARMLDRIRGLLGAPLRVLSCYRNEAYNSCISGAGGSFHKRFNAIDWRCDTGTVTQWRDVARQVRASEPRFRGGIGFYPGSSFIHIDTRGTNADW